MKLKDLILWILFIIALIISGWYLFGNSPTLEEALSVLILTIIYASSSKISDIELRLNSMGKKFSNLEKVLLS